MKKTIEFIKKKFKDIYSQVWWFLYSKGFMKKYRAQEDEVERLEHEWQEKCRRDYEAMLEEERLKWEKEEEDLRRDRYDEDRELRIRAEEDFLENRQADRDLERDNDYECHYCCYPLSQCNCDEKVEDFSEHPSLSAEDDTEPLSPEMEYWFTKCPKCGKYPEFCPCDGKFED